MEIKNRIHKLKEILKYKSILMKYKLYSLLKRGFCLNSSPRSKLLIVSLTTYPKRFSTVYLTIESLMNQTKKPDKIILWLAKCELKGREIPKSILNLKARGLEVRVVNENLRSYKKLVYAIQEFTTSNIITCDDDVIYPNYFIDGLFRKSKQFPDAIIAYRCTLMKKNQPSQLDKYLNWKKVTNNVPSFNIFPTGVGGILYPPNSLHNTVLDKALFLKLSPTGDDIWFKAMALLNNTKTVVVADKCIEPLIIKGSQTNALWLINVNEYKNDEQFKNVFDYFNLYDYIE